MINSKGTLKKMLNCSDPTWGELYTQLGFFVQTILADRYIRRRNVSGIIKKLVQRRVQEKKRFFFKFRFYFEELSRIEVLREHGIFGMTMFTFSDM